MSTVCQLIDFGGRTGGSFMPAIESLARALTRRGHRCVVVASEVANATWPRDLLRSGAELHLVKGAAEASAQARAARPDIVHAHFTRFDIPALSCNGAAHIFWHMHSHRERSSALLKAKALLKYRAIGARVEAFVTVSEAMRRECIEWYAPEDRVRVIHNGINCAQFRPPDTSERAAARAAFGIAPGDRVALFFDRVPYKGGAVVREALRKMPGVRVLVTGGSTADQEMFKQLPGAIVLERVPDARLLYWAADALAFASDREAFGFVLVEALACGLPIAASDIPVVHELCAGAQDVYPFAARDPAALAQALDRALTCMRSRSGREVARERFTLARWTRDMLCLYGLQSV